MDNGLPQVAKRPGVGECLVALAGEVNGLLGAVVSTLDGFAIAHAGSAQAVDRLAAMSSSLLAIATALGQEVGVGKLDALILDASGGKVVMLAIPGKDLGLLMVACTDGCLIGNLLWCAKECVRKIANSC